MIIEYTYPAKCKDCKHFSSNGRGKKSDCKHPERISYTKSTDIVCDLWELG